MPITLRILGGVELRNPSGAELRRVLTQPKRLGLLAFLAHSRERPFHSRETLLGLLWPELDEERGRAALSQAVYYLRRAVGADTLVSRGDEIGIDPERLWCDVVAFERALEADDLVAALELYRGDLLAGLFLVDGNEWERWLESERSRVRERALLAARRLSENLEERGRISEALHWARRAVALSENDESDVRRLIVLLDRSGDRAGAVRAYEQLARYLAVEYELEVSPRTRELIEEVRSREVRADGTEGSQGRSVPASSILAEANLAWPAREREGRRNSRGRALLLGGAILAIAVLAMGLPRIWFGDDHPRTSVIEPTRTDSHDRIAVLPFDNFGPDPGDLYLADGMTEELITRLSMLSGLRVVAGTSVMRYRGTGKRTSDIGHELGVGYLLEGSVRRSGDRMRIAVQLVDARTEQHLWANDYEGTLDELLDVQREIAERVVAAIPVRAPEPERLRLTNRGTSDPSAHLLYLRGRRLLGNEDSASFARARDYFERALQRDSTYARAWSGLSDALDRLIWAHALPPDSYPEVRTAAERALELNPDLADAHVSLARTLTAYEWDSEAAEHHFRRAIALDPSHAKARRAYSSHLLYHGRFAEARTQAEAAVALDPLSFFPHFQLVLVSFFQRRYDEAIERAEELVGMDPSAWSAHFMRAKAHVEKGEYDAALDHLARADPTGTFPPVLAIRGYVLGRTGRHEEAHRAQQALASRDLGRFTALERALIHLGLGENEAALDLLEEAVERRDPRVRLLGEEPIFDDLRSESRYHALLVRVGLES